MPFPPNYTRAWDNTFPPDSQLAKLGPLDFHQLREDIQQRLYQSGTLANRPTPEAGFLGVIYVATDVNKIYSWGGAAWVDITAVFASMVPAPTPFPTDGARAYRSTHQSIAHGTPTAIIFDNVRYNDNALWVVGNPTRLTCKRVGKYSIWGGVGWDAHITGSREIRIRLNGATYLAVTNLPPIQLGEPSQAQEAKTLWKMSVNDYVELVVWQNRGGNLNVLSSTFLGNGSFSPEFAMQYESA